MQHAFDSIAAMNPIVLYFASGESLYGGTVLLILAIMVSPFVQSRPALLLRNVVAWLALAMIVMASSPCTWIIYLAFLISFLLWYLASNLKTPLFVKTKAQLLPPFILLSFLIGLPVSELFHREMPVIERSAVDHLVVIGDSVSSGIDPRVPAWPAILQAMTGAPIRNLARPGALTIEGLEMARELKPDDQLVLIELGGNDLLSGGPSGDFDSALDALLQSVKAPGRTVVMFELPLLPHKVAFGQIQRRLAKKYQIVLIPKRFFVDVIRGADATSDGVHLSDTGALRMASLVARALSSVLKPPRKGDNSTPRSSG